MLIMGNMSEMAAQATQPIYPDDGGGELSGWFIPIIIGASSLIGGGTLWVMHEKHTEVEMYYECLEKAVTQMSMSPEEAKYHCSPKLEPRKPLLDLALSKGTIAGVGVLVVGLWYVTKLLSTAMKT